jgi:hypothetical protein
MKHNSGERQQEHPELRIATLSIIFSSSAGKVDHISKIIKKAEPEVTCTPAKTPKPIDGRLYRQSL